jgi:P27 family predicted phage terminase small subunit
MGRRGPAPTPTGILQMRGTFRKDRHGDPETEPQPKPVARVPKAPAHLDDIARRAWKTLAKQLHELGLLSAGDLLALEAACTAYSRALQADELLAEEGLTQRGLQGYTAHPAVAISRYSWATYRQFAQEFGLTPSARTRVRTKEKPAGSGSAPADPWTKLARGASGRRA